MTRCDEYLDRLVLPETFKFQLSEDKKAIFRALCLDMLECTLEMFEWDGLTPTLSSRSMEIEMQTRGYCVISEVKNPLHGDAGFYCFRYASPSGELNSELLPTQMVVVDVWTGFNKTLTIGEDCIVIPNDILWRGLGDLFALHAGQLADAHTTMRLQLYNARINKILSATDDKVVTEALNMLNDLKDGKWGVIGDSVELMGMMKALSSVDFSSPHSGSIKDTMEVIQYYLAQWHIAVGLNDNFNMKREALNGKETESNADVIFTLPLSMLKQRQKGAEMLKTKYNIPASVKFGSTWQTAYKKYLMTLKSMMDVVSKDEPKKESDAKDEEVKPDE